MARQVLDNGVILPSEYSDDWYDDMTSNLNKLDEVIGSDAEKLSASDVGAAAISNDYDDLDDKPTYNILRRASVTLTAGGTGNYSDLDSYSKIKAGDYVLDAANKLYSITAIDAANSTYTVSAAALFTVTDKAELGAAALSNDYDDLNNLPGYGILRFCSTAITDNSSVAFANISSVSKIAAGDFLLDTAAKLYTVSAVDTANETVSITTPLTQLAVDANVVHISGNESIGGQKSFTNDTTVSLIKSVTNLATGSTTGSSILPLLANITYTDGTATKTARLNFRIQSDGSVTLYPHENNQYSLGLTTRKWSAVYGTAFYYGSNAVEFSQKFVTTDTAQDISANKNFKGLITTIPNETLWPTNTNTSADITSLGDSSIHIEYKASGQLTDLSGGAWGVAELGVGCFFFRINNGTDIRFKHLTQNTVNRIPVVSNANRQLNSLIPETDNTYGLGSSSLRWSTINGLKPGSLSLPDLSNGLDISGYIDVSTTSEYTAISDGYISICGTASSTNAIAIKDKNFDYAVTGRALTISSIATTYVLIPVLANHTYEIICSAVTSIVYAKFFPNLGNV